MAAASSVYKKSFDPGQPALAVQAALDRNFFAVNCEFYCKSNG